MTIVIRDFCSSDLDAIRQLFYDTVRTINCHDYTPEQIDVWSASAQDEAFWQTRLQTRLTYVAVAHQEQAIVGFAMLERTGYIDCFYCHPDYQGQGIGSKLLRHLEASARSLSVKRLVSEVSVTAKPFFQHQGYVVVQEQEVERRGVQFCNFLMEKYLEN